MKPRIDATKPISVRLGILASGAKDLMEQAEKLLPKEAVVIGGKYAGRLGKVTGAILWSNDGLLIDFYVYKKTRLRLQEDASRRTRQSGSPEQ